MPSWRDHISPLLREDLNSLLTKVAQEKSAYTKGTSASQAQIWVALSILHKEISDLRLRIDKIEKLQHPKKYIKLKRALKRL